jgi:hypothetical protein
MMSKLLASVLGVENRKCGISSGEEPVQEAELIGL